MMKHVQQQCDQESSSGVLSSVTWLCHEVKRAFYIFYAFYVPGMIVLVWDWAYTEMFHDIYIYNIII